MKQGRANLNENELFKPTGWANLYPKVRGDLVLLFDDGYYPGGNMQALQLDPKKFPSYASSSPEATLEHLNNDLKKAGWRGLGLWTRGVGNDDAANREKVEWSRDAGVLYWKIDTGDEGGKYKKIVQEIAPQLTLEYAIGTRPFNRGPQGRVDADYGSKRLPLLQMADVVRIYDRDQPLSLPTSIDRIASLLQVSADKPDAKAIINCEDEVYLGAALGCSVGIFRTPYVGLRPSGDMDIYMGGPKHPKLCTDEVTRAIRWHRVAPPYSANIGPVNVDTTILSDSWKFSQGDSWDQGPNGKIDSQSAPARVSRGLPLPIVNAEGDVPWVLASRNPNGALTVAALGRITPEKGYYIPKADIQVQAGAFPPAIGIFGSYKSLTLIFDQPIDGKKIFAQDLAGEEAQDITSQVTIQGAQLTIPGDLIDKVGLAAAGPGDKSDPGLIMVMQ
jgi:hypothetical protein